MDPTNLNPTAKAVIIVFWPLFNLALIGLITKFGDPHNSLHTSGQWLAYAAVLGTLAGLGFPSMLEALKTKPPSA
jgi:ABC-type antimicrobial peptide transport system permease subunit